MSNLLLSRSDKEFFVTFLRTAYEVCQRAAKDDMAYSEVRDVVTVVFSLLDPDAYPIHPYLKHKRSIDTDIKPIFPTFTPTLMILWRYSMYRKRVPSTVFVDAFGQYYSNDTDYYYSQEQLKAAYEAKKQASSQRQEVAQ